MATGLKSDLNKGIINITYNDLNLPLQISYTGNNRIVYSYDAAGNKRKQEVYDEFHGKKPTTTTFIGNFVYQNGVLMWINYDEGRVVCNKGLTVNRTEVFLKDHLGNVRVVLDNTTGQPVQHTNYYPFGMQMYTQPSLSSSNNINEYLYNGKMYQDELGLGWYDYGARFYDGVVGRFHSIDPIAENFSRQSPFVYADNNPVKFIDFMGMNADGYLMDEQGNIDAKPINNEGGNNFDVIYNKKNYSEETRKDYDVSGNKTGIAVSKQVIENHHKTTLNITDVAGSKTGEVKTNDKYTTKNDAEAQLLMNFVNKNTNVEWSNTLMSRNGQALNVVMTSHELQTVSYSSEQLQKYSNVGYSIIRNDHIHPDQFSFTSSIPDRRMKNWFLDNNKDIITRILFKGRYYPF